MTVIPHSKEVFFDLNSHEIRILQIPQSGAMKIIYQESINNSNYILSGI